MKQNRKYSLTIIMLFIMLLPSAWSDQRTSDNSLSAISGIWDEFSSALRRGDYAQAYSRLSPASRSRLQYRDFCVQWHPVNIRYNVILSNPSFSDFSIFGNIAEVRMGNNRDIGSDKQNIFRIILTNKDGKWWIVDDCVLTETVIDAAIRGVLADLVKESAVLNQAFATGKGSIEEISKELPLIFSARRGRLAVKNYRLELDLLRDCVLRALPLNAAFPAYQINQQGIISRYNSTKPVNKLTSQEVMQQRLQKKDSARQQIARKQQENLLKAQKELDKLKNKNLPKVPDNSDHKTARRSSLPETPPEFPQEFTLQSQPKQTEKKLFLGKDEEFDLPEINSIIFTSQQKTPEENMEDGQVYAALPENTSTMAASSDSQIHQTNVILDTDRLLDELDSMLLEFQENSAE